MLASHLKNYIIVPTLQLLGNEFNSNAAINLLLGTAAQESHLGKYLHQLNGEALGIYQIEMDTHIDIYENYLQYRSELLDKITTFLISFKLTNSNPILRISYYEQNLIGNLYYATAIARLIYYRVSEKLPEADDIEGLAEYWKKYYNTEKGKGTVKEFVENYKRFVFLDFLEDD